MSIRLQGGLTVNGPAVRPPRGQLVTKCETFKNYFGSFIKKASRIFKNFKSGAFEVEVAIHSNAMRLRQILNALSAPFELQAFGLEPSW